MPWPVGVTTRTISLSMGVGVEWGTAVDVRAIIKSNQALVWIGTGENVFPTGKVYAAGNFDLPVTDQDLVWGDGNGNAYTTAGGYHTHSYRVDIEYYVDGRWVKGKTIPNLVLPTGVSTIDLDLVVTDGFVSSPIKVALPAFLGGSSGGGSYDGPQFFTPEQFFAVGDGVADDTNSIQAAFDAAYNAGGGVVWLSKRYGWRGDLYHRGAMVVWGTGVRKVLAVDDNKDRGLVALDGTARYVYGQWGGGSVNDNPGPVANLVIDGKGVGGATQLFLMQCVDGAVVDCRIVRSAGDCVELGGSQNSSFERTLIGYAPAGAAINTYNAAGQSAGNIKFNNCYIADSLVFLDGDCDPGQVWAHDIMFDQCLFENHSDNGSNLIHLKAGDWQFSRCVFTNSNASTVPPTNDCVVLIEQSIFPTVATAATFDSCYFNGGTNGVTDLIRVKTVTGTGVGNIVRFYGRNSFSNGDNIICIDGGAAFSSRVSVEGTWLLQAGTLNPYRAINSGALYYIFEQYAGPKVFSVPDDPSGTAPAALSFKRDVDAQARHSVDRDGTHLWKDGTSTATKASLAYDATNDRMSMGNTWIFANAWQVKHAGVTVTTPGQAVALSGAKTATPGATLAFTANNATATISITGGTGGSQFQLCLSVAAGLTGCSVTWPSNMKFQGTAPQPVAGEVMVINFLLVGTDWIAIGTPATVSSETIDDRVAALVQAGSGLTITYDDVANTLTFDAGVNQIEEDRITTGQECFSRDFADQNGIATVNGLLSLMYFTAYKTETITKLASYCGNTAQTGGTLCRMGLYTIDGSGNLTLVASTPNDTTLWTVANSRNEKALSASYGVVKGTRYAIGLILVGSTVACTWVGRNLVVGLVGQSPRLYGQLSGQTDLPASIAVGSIANGTASRYMELVP